MKPPTQMPPRAMEPEQGESAAHENAESGREEATEDGTQASPEEQAIYDMMVNQALDIIYPDDGSNKPRDQIVENLRGVFDEQVTQLFQSAEPPISETPDDAVAVTSVVLTMMTEGMLAQKGTDVPDDVVFQAGREIVEVLIELSEGLGLADFAQGDVDDIFLRALDLYRLASPRVDPETLTGEFEQIIAADKSGNIGKLLPGAEKYAQQRGGSEAPPQQPVGAY